MENNENLNSIPEESADAEMNETPATLPEEPAEAESGEALTAAEGSEANPDADAAEGNGNLEICPNCLEPNTEDLAVCKYCGMPLHQGADADEFVSRESEAEMAANRAAAVPQEKKSAKKQENGFRRIMPWLGLYLIYYAITGVFDIRRQIKAAEEAGEAVNAPLAYLAQGIWFVAGVMMAWPLIKKGYRKLRHLPEPDEEEETAEQSGEGSAETEDEVLIEDAEENTGSEDEAAAETEDDVLIEDAEEETSAEDDNSASEDEPWTADKPVGADMLLKEDPGTGEVSIDESDAEFEDEDKDAARWL